jgi:hypothetical protein
MTKRGWNDDSSAELEDYKRTSGLSDRPDLMTFFDFYEVDDGRNK